MIFIVCDLDGTLFDDSHRLKTYAPPPVPGEALTNKHWLEYHSHAHNDQRNDVVSEYIHYMLGSGRAKTYLIYSTGRNEIFHGMTQLKIQMEMGHKPLFMPRSFVLENEPQEVRHKISGESSILLMRPDDNHEPAQDFKPLHAYELIKTILNGDSPEFHDILVLDNDPHVCERWYGAYNAHVMQVKIPANMD